MAGRNGQEFLGTYVPVDLANRFRAQARRIDGGASAALRRLVAVAVDGCDPAQPKGVGRGRQVGVRLKDEERRALEEAAASRGTTPANWIRSLAIAHLSKRPQWSTTEVDALREVFRELRAIGNNLNQIARVLNKADYSGDIPPDQGVAARSAAEAVRMEMRRVVAIMSGNFDYWGLPDDERPTAARGAMSRAKAAVRASAEDRARRPRRRPSRFAE